MSIPQGIKRVICLFLAACFFLQNTLTCYGQGLVPVLTPPALNFNPPTLKYLSVNSANPNNYFNFLLDKGQTVPVTNASLEKEAKKLIHYFFIGLTLPESSLWVNLRPDEPGRITSLELAQTDMGKLLLEQDLRLKKDVAQYLNPKHPTGKMFWEELYAQAELLLGKGKLKKTAITTSSRVWIVPDEAVVMETEDGALVTQAKLKVLLESEYLSLKSKSWNKEVEVQIQNNDQLKNLTEQLMKSIIIPEISKEVNSGKNYAPLRQIYHSLILAQWFKRKNSRTHEPKNPYAQAIDQSWLKGLESEFPWSKDAIWREYLTSFQKGEYQLKEKLTGLNRMYTSGGMVFPISGILKAETLGVGASSPIKQDDNNVPITTRGDGNSLLPEIIPVGVIDNNKQPVLSSPPDNSLPTEGRILSSAAASQQSKDTNASSSPINNQKIPNLVQRVIELANNIINEARLKYPLVSHKVSAPGQTLQSDAQTIRSSQEAFSFTDTSQDFLGVDLEHFIHAQYRLAQRGLSEEILKQLLEMLNIDSRLSGESAYRAIYERLIDRGYAKPIIDLINADTYADPRLRIEIIGQNLNPRAQGVYEAVANSLDALGFSIGQFGKGVKQIIDWLEPTGEDRIDVFTRVKYQDKTLGHPYQLSILKSKQGQCYIQLKKISAQVFRQVAGESVEHGTVVRVTAKTRIPRTNEEFDPNHRNNQASIAEGIHRRFAYAPSLNIITQIMEGQPQEVNGFGEKVVIVPARAVTYVPAERYGKNIRVVFADNAITIVDNGSGMNAETLARMFVPKQGTKHPEPLHSQAAQAELEKVKVVEDCSLPHRVSFSRNGEVVVAIDISLEIQESATAPGGLMLEFGSLLDVPESRDSIIIPLDLKPGEISNFQLAVEYAINQIIGHPNLSDIDKVRYVNTIIAGLDGLVQGNPNYGHIIRAIRGKAQTALANTIIQLRKRGFVILPHNRQFEKLAIPEGKRTLFVHEHLFDWQGAISLKELGGEIVPGITLNGEERLPLVVVPFTSESMQDVKQFNSQWHAWPEAKRLPIIRTDRFVAIPLQLGKRLQELATKRASSPFTGDEEEEFSSLAQLVNIITASKVSTAYEVTEVEPQMTIMPVAELQRSTGEIDSQAINNFLTTSAVVTPAYHSGIKGAPSNANQKHILLEDGDLVEVETGRRVYAGVQEIDPLGSGYYKLKISPEIPGLKPVYRLVRITETNVIDILTTQEQEKLIISPNKKFAFILQQHQDVESVYDMEAEKTYYLQLDFSPLLVSDDSLLRTAYSNLQFSYDGNYLVYLEKSFGGSSVRIVTVNLQERRMIRKATLASRDVSDIEYATNPFGNVAFIRYKNSSLLQLLDLTTGSVVANAKHLHTNSVGVYTVIIGFNGEMSIYLHKAKRVLTANDFGSKRIELVRTGWKSGQMFFEVRAGGTDWYRFYEDGRTTIVDFPPEYFEEFNRFGMVSISPMPESLQEKQEGRVVIDPDRVDSFQRVNYQGIYKHPNFELFIDNSDPTNLVAINPISGRRFPYKGRILTSVYFPQTGRHGDPEFIPEIDYIVVQSKDNEIAAIEHERVKDVYDSGPVRTTIPWLTQAVTTAEAPYFAVGTDAAGVLDRDNYILYDLDLSRSMNDIWKRIRVIPIPLTYSQVYYDGTYFVFVNPENGDVVYLDPTQPEQPIFASIRPENAFIDAKPADAPNQVVIVRQGDGEVAVLDTITGKQAYLRSPGLRLNDVIRINDSTIVGLTMESDAPYSYNTVFQRNKNGWDVLRNVGRVLWHSGRLIGAEGVVFVGERTIRKAQHVFDAVRNKLFLSSQTVHLSASGQFSVHFQEDGDLVYYNHDENEPVPKLIATAEKYKAYRVSSRADVVIIKLNNGKYSLYSLQIGGMVTEDVDHIEIDSSGMIVIMKIGGTLNYVSLGGGDGGWRMLGNTLRVASDKQFVYLIEFRDSEKPRFITIYNKSNGHYKEAIDFEAFMSNPDYALPRFWEEYGLEKKRIWDGTEGKQDIEIWYQKNPAENPSQETKLVWDVVIWWNREADGRIRVLNYASNNSPEDYYHTASIDEIDSLRGGKVWYRKGKGSDSEQRISIKLLGKSFNVRFVNQSKDFMLVESEKAIYNLIDSNGNIIDIANQIPPGFIPTDVNGEYFIFINSQAGEVMYFNPHTRKHKRVISEALKPSSDGAQQAVKLWNGCVLTSRDQWIAQAKAIYQSFLDLVPEEYRGEIEPLIKPAIEQIYQQQEQEIRRLFQHSIESGQPIDLSAPLPFDEFSRRMSHIRQNLEQFLADGEEVINQEEVRVRLKFYRNLLPALFSLVVNRDFNITKLSVSTLHAVALGWGISRQDQLDDAPLVAALYHALSQLHTGPPLSVSEAMKIISFAAHISLKGQEQHRILITQLKKLIPDISAPSSSGFEAIITKRLALLTKLRESFQRVELSALVAYLSNPAVYHNLGEARVFVVFLSNEVEPVKEKKRVALRGEDISLPEQGVSISQIMNLELKRPKHGRDDVVMSIDYLLAHLDNLPVASEEGEAEILRNTTVQRESGAYTAEIAQNSRDATRGAKGILEVDFYLQEDESGKAEYVEEARDNGTGALQEVALLIPKSTKAAGEQVELTGFFGTGKYTIFEGVDRVEIITKNQDRAYAFTFTVFKGNGQAAAIKLTGARRLTDTNLTTGVTVRRIKIADNTIPELDQMLAWRSWKTFAGLSQHQAGQESFTIYSLDQEGKRQKLEVEKSVLSENEFRAANVGEQQVTNFGAMRIISTKDMPLQVVNKAGLRIKEIPQEYLALVPGPLREHIKELGINIQIPLPLIRGRSAFEHEAEYLPVIQRYVALEFYKAIAYKALTQTSPQFVFENFPLDWEANDHYWDSINLQDQAIANLAARINKGEYDAVSAQELQLLLVKSGERDPAKKFTKLLVLLETDTPSGRMSLLLRRLAIQKQLNDERAAQQTRMLMGLGLEIDTIPDVRAIPNYEARLVQGRSIETAHEQMRNPEQYIIDPSQYNTQEQKLVQLALSAAKTFGLEQVLLVSEEVRFAGAFIRYQGKTAMLLKRSLADTLGQKNSRIAIYDQTTDTISHELAHLLEEIMRLAQQEQIWREGFVSHSSNFTHDAIGSFAEAMRYVAGVWLASRATDYLSKEEQGGSAASPLKQEGNDEFKERQEALEKLIGLLKREKVDIDDIEQMLNDESILKAIPELRKLHKVLTEGDKAAGHVLDRLGHSVAALKVFEWLSGNILNTALDSQANAIKTTLANIRDEIVKEEKDRYLLRLAILLHDIGKRPEKNHLDASHEEVGAADVLPLILGRIGDLTDEDKETVSYLVEHHSVLGFFSQKESIHSYEFIVEASDVLGRDLKRIKMLYLLNVVDSIAVDPMKYKDSSMRLLPLANVFEIISGWHNSLEEASEKVETKFLSKILPDIGKGIKELYLKLVGLTFIAGAGDKRVVNHLSLLEAVSKKEMEGSGETKTEVGVAVSNIIHHDGEEYKELAVAVSRDEPGLLGAIAGTLANLGYDIHLAWIETAEADGKKIVFDRFLIKRDPAKSGNVKDDKEADEKQDNELKKAITDKIKSFLNSEDANKIDDGIEEKLQKITIANLKVGFLDIKEAGVTQVTIEAIDSPGLLSKIMDIISGLDLNVSRAKIETRGRNVKDIFYVQENGKPLSEESKKRLSVALKGSTASSPIEQGKEADLVEFEGKISKILSEQIRKLREAKKWEENEASVLVEEMEKRGIYRNGEEYTKGHLVKVLLIKIINEANSSGNSQNLLNYISEFLGNSEIGEERAKGMLNYLSQLIHVKGESMSSPVAVSSVSSEEAVGGIDLSHIEVTLKDEKFVSQLNPADLKVMRAAKYLKEGWGSLSLLYVHEIMLLLKDNLASDVKHKGLLQEVLKQLQVKGFIVPEIRLAVVG